MGHLVEGRLYLVSQIVHVEVTGVDDQVRLTAQAAQQVPLGGYAVHQSPVTLQGMLAANVLEATDQHVVGRLEEKHLRTVAATVQISDHST
jgi:hypothetical protein